MAKMNDGAIPALGVSPGVVGLVNQARGKVAAAARAAAPVKSGAYRRGIVERGKIQRQRYVGLVVATDPKSLLIESQKGILARALGSAARGRG